MESKNFDVIIIGGGAAGLMCALEASRNAKKILLIEHNKTVGEKIRISGGGRCNFTNIHTSKQNFLSQNPHFVISALSRFSPDDFIKLLKKHEITFHEKTLGQLFCDISAKQIINMFLSELALNKVEIMLETSVEKIEKNAEKFFLQTNKGNFQSDALVIATGGLSIPKIGASNFGYKIAKQFGLKIIETTPALVGLKIKENLVTLAGISFDSEVSYKKTSFREAVLITHRGLSGPAILQISSYVKTGDKITINMVPNQYIYNYFLEKKQTNPKQEITNIISEFLPKNLAIWLTEKSQGRIADFSNAKLKEIANSINSWQVEIVGNEGYEKAEVTLGGIDTDEISSKNFECKKVPNLYFIGEVLDVTGHLGGFNFQFAWACGFACGESLK